MCVYICIYLVLSLQVGTLINRGDISHKTKNKTDNKYTINTVCAVYSQYTMLLQYESRLS